MGVTPGYFGVVGGRLGEYQPVEPHFAVECIKEALLDSRITEFLVQLSVISAKGRSRSLSLLYNAVVRAFITPT